MSFKTLLGFSPFASHTWRLPFMALMMWCLLIVALTFMGGCSVLAPHVGPALTKAVTRYCAEPQAERLLLRQQVNASIAPNSAQVNCAVDTGPPLQ